MDTSNLINLGILCVTALVGVLAWVGARQAAKEARADQEAATIAANRSAAAAEAAARSQARMVEIESQRHEEAALDARRARLFAVRTRKEHHKLSKTHSLDYLTIRILETQ